jgi:hypothetical protein
VEQYALEDNGHVAWFVRVLTEDRYRANEQDRRSENGPKHEVFREVRVGFTVNRKYGYQSIVLPRWVSTFHT